MTPPTQQDKPIDLEALRLAAEAATPGPWRECGQSRGGCSCGQIWATTSDEMVATAWRGDDMLPATSVAPKVNAAYIAAFSPSTVFSLLALIDAQQKKIAALEGAAGFAADLEIPEDGIGL